jgi:hypothetical protein
MVCKDIENNFKIIETNFQFNQKKKKLWCGKLKNSHLKKIIYDVN